MTGWGQDGPLANAAGHDINYVALTGALHAIGERGGKPVVPLNLVGDFGGGGMFLAYGMVCALLEARRSGKGQVVDAAMVDGASTLMAMMYAAFQSGFWSNSRGSNMLDGGAHFYGVYETADGKYVSIGSIEPQFYALLLEKLGIDPQSLPHQMDPRHWEALRDRFDVIFRTRSREQWCALMEGTDICFAPVLGLDEVAHHPNPSRSPDGACGLRGGHRCHTDCRGAFSAGDLRLAGRWRGGLSSLAAFQPRLRNRFSFLTREPALPGSRCSRFGLTQYIWIDLRSALHGR
jgi:crotonobetainyl-CoA:carnitine CoA-transferase CaiB-like acyl-CoA transferase